MVRYEWVVEEMDGEDIVDTFQFTTYKEALAFKAKQGASFVIGLVRDVIDAYGDLDDRAWAYVENGVLPSTFDNGKPVPAKYRTEFAA